MGKIGFHLLNDNLLLEEQSDRFNVDWIIYSSGYAYCLFDEQQGLLAYSYIKPQTTSQEKFPQGFLAEQMSSDKLSKLTLIKKQITVAFSEFALIPEKLFDRMNVEDYLDNPESSRILHYPCSFRKENMNLVFSIPERIFNILSSRYRHTAIRHIVDFLLKSGERLLKKSKSFIYIYIIGQLLYVMCVRDKSLVAINVYNIVHVNDALYFLQLNAEQLSINQSKQLTLFAAGEINPELRALLSNYFEFNVLQVDSSYYGQAPLDSSMKEIFAVYGS